MCLRKRLLSITTALMMVLSLAPAVAFADDDAASAAETNAVTEEVAEEVTEEAAEEMTEEMAEEVVEEVVPNNAAIIDGGETGEVEWSLDKDGVLTIFGYGQMAKEYNVWENEDRTFTDNRPWKHNRDKITKVVIEEGVTSISQYAFAYLENVKEIVIPSTMEEIRAVQYYEDDDETYYYNNALFYCTSLEKITVSPDNDKFFTDKYGVLYEKVSSSNWALLYCPAYADIEVYSTPYQCRRIEEYAFAHNQNIKELYIHDNCTAMEYGVLFGFNRIEILKIPAEVPWIEMILRHGYSGSVKEFQVAGTSSMYKVVDGVLYTADGTELIKCPGAYKGPLKVLDGTKIIGQMAISDCTQVTSVQLPNSVEEIYSWAFNGSQNIKEVTLGSKVNESLHPEVFSGSFVEKINVSSSNKYFASVDGIVFNKAKDKLVIFPPGRGGSYTVPKNVKTIGEMAFYNNYNLTNIDFAGVVTNFDYCAFGGCEALTEVIFPQWVGYSIEYGSSVFAECKNLKKVVFPQNVYEMGEGTFEGCSESLVVHARRNSYPEAAAEAVGAEVVAVNDSGAYIDYAYKEYKTPFYTLYSTGVLEITGSGYVTTAFRDDDDESYEHEYKIQHVIIGEDIDGIEADALGGLPNLKSIRFEGWSCDIEEGAFGWIWEYDEETEEQIRVSKDNLTILAEEGSDAEDYWYDTEYYLMDFEEFSKETCPKHVTKKTYKAATAKSSGAITYTCKYCNGLVDKETVPAISNVVLSATSYKYDGKTKKPTVKVTDAAGKVIDKDYYDVTYAKGRKNVGKYKVTVKFDTARYKATITKTFKINPAGKSISKISPSKKAFTVKWKKASSSARKQITGYQIQYSTSSKMTSPKKVTVSKSTATSKKISSKIKAKKTYYVQLRTYKKIGSSYYYSTWSSAKKVKTK